MLHGKVKGGLLYAFIYPFNSSYNAHDQIPEDKERELFPGEIGLDRVYKIFYDKDGYLSNEFMSIMSITSCTAFIGFCYAGMIRGKQVTDEFIIENRASKFNSTYEAQRQLRNTFFGEFVRAGVPFGLKIGLFSCIFSSTSIGLYTYRGKYDILNFICSGALTGCLFKINMGLKGVVAGTVVGSTLGLIYGAMTQLLLFITGVKLEQVYDVHVSFLNERRNIISKHAQEYMKTIEEVKIYDENQMLRTRLENQAKKDSKVQTNT